MLLYIGNDIFNKYDANPFTSTVQSRYETKKTVIQTLNVRLFYADFLADRVKFQA